jgi:hypothetical protein
MSEPPDPAEPAGESLEMVTAALRADAADVEVLVQVLVATLGEALPPGMVTVERSRGLTDRLAKRAGAVVAVTVTTPDLLLRLAPSRDRHGPVRAELQRIVRGVVISRRDVSLDEWIEALAQALTELAAQSEAARRALTRLLGG